LTGTRAPLASNDVLQQLHVAQDKVGVLEAILESVRLALLARINAIGQAIAQWLAGKAVHHGLDSMGLVGLYFEFEFHLTTDLLCKLSAGCSLQITVTY